jgi:hypothetical protein
MSEIKVDRRVDTVNEELVLIYYEGRLSLDKHCIYVV